MTEVYIFYLIPKGEMFLNTENGSQPSDAKVYQIKACIPKLSLDRFKPSSRFCCGKGKMFVSDGGIRMEVKNFMCLSTNIHEISWDNVRDLKFDFEINKCFEMRVDAVVLQISVLEGDMKFLQEKFVSLPETSRLTGCPFCEGIQYDDACNICGKPKGAFLGSMGVGAFVGGLAAFIVSLVLKLFFKEGLLNDLFRIGSVVGMIAAVSGLGVYVYYYFTVSPRFRKTGR